MSGHPGHGAGTFRCGAEGAKLFVGKTHFCDKEYFGVE